MRFPENRVLTLGRSGVISRPPQTGGPASLGWPETLTASTVVPDDEGLSCSRLLSCCLRVDVLFSCRNAGASCFGLLRRLYDVQPVQTALIFDNRIGLLEASALYADCWWFRTRGRLVVRRLAACFYIESGERSLIEKASAWQGFGLAALMNLRV